jgi:hypothetical protein
MIGDLLTPPPSWRELLRDIWISVGKGEPCNWCPAEPPAVAEDDSKKETEKCQTSPSAD